MQLEKSQSSGGLAHEIFSEEMEKIRWVAIRLLLNFTVITLSIMIKAWPMVLMLNNQQTIFDVSMRSTKTISENCDRWLRLNTKSS